MTQDKSTPRPWKLNEELWCISDANGVVFLHLGRDGMELWRLILAAVNSHDAMKECVEALKKVLDEVDEGGLTPDGNMIAALIDLPLAKRARSALAKLEKENVG